MKPLLAALPALAAAFALAGAASAQEQPVKEPAEAAAPEDTAQSDESPIDIAFNIGVASDYVFRGVSQTDEEVQVFGGVDATFGSAYAGVWASNVDFSPFGDTSTEAEIDIYAGFKPEAGGFVFDFGGIYYTYLDQPEGSAELNYFEFKAAASRAVGPATFGGAIFYSPEFTGEVGDATYFEANAAYTINDVVSVSGALGRQTFADIDADYTTWNLGATFVVGPGFGLDIRYWDTDEHDFGEIYEGRVVASLKKVF
jgi:uncharacterized protein (TIGR02001 family)